MVGKKREMLDIDKIVFLIKESVLWFGDRVLKEPFLDAYSVSYILLCWPIWNYLVVSLGGM